MPKESPKTYSEKKEKRMSLSLTPTGYEGFAAVAQELGLSMSELIERIGRRQISLNAASQQLGESSAN